jgi:hypothetical protein
MKYYVRNFLFVTANQEAEKDWESIVPVGKIFVFH